MYASYPDLPTLFLHISEAVFLFLSAGYSPRAGRLHDQELFRVLVAKGLVPITQSS